MRIARKLFALRSNLKRLRQQCITSQHGDAFAKNFVVGRLAAAKIIVIHRRQIIVDERVSVDALHRARERHGVGIFSAARFRRRQQNCRAHPFAAGEERVTHRLVDGGGTGGRGRQETIERAVDRFGA